MTDPDRPANRAGKICYLEIPATDIARSADFYQRAFGWNIRRDSHGTIAFDDTVGGVSGTWCLGRKPATEPSLIVSVMVASAANAVAAIVAAGGEIVRPVDAGGPGEGGLVPRSRGQRPGHLRGPRTGRGRVNLSGLGGRRWSTTGRL